MKRGSKYLPMIQNVFRAEGLPLDLAYVPLVESAFKPNALSRAKAKGVWQFMPARRSKTACAATGTSTSAPIRKRRRSRRRSTCRRWPGCSTATGISRWRRTTAARAACSGRSSAAASTTSGRWPTKPKLLPRETREYVPMILAAIVIARNPGAVRLRLRAGSRAAEYEKVTLPRPVDLRRVAEWADTTIDEIQALNPELRRWTTPVRDGRSTTLKVPAGTRRPGVWRGCRTPRQPTSRR